MATGTQGILIHRIRSALLILLYVTIQYVTVLITKMYNTMQSIIQ